MSDVDAIQWAILGGDVASWYSAAVVLQMLQQVVVTCE